MKYHLAQDGRFEAVQLAFWLTDFLVQPHVIELVFNTILLLLQSK